MQEKIAKKGGTILSNLVNKMTEADRIRNSLQEKVSVETAKIKNFEKAIKNDLKQVEELEREGQDVDSRMKEKLKKIDEITAVAAEIMKQLNEKKEKLILIKTEISDLSKALEGVRKEYDLSKKEYEESTKEVATIENALKDLVKIELQCQSKLKDLRNAYEEVVRKYDFASILQDLKAIKPPGIGSTPRRQPSQPDRSASPPVTSARMIHRIDWTPVFTVPVSADYPQETLELFREHKKEIEVKKGHQNNSKSRKNPNLDVLMKFQKSYNEFKTRQEAFEKLRAESDGMKQKLESLKTRRLNEFFEGFNVICLKLKETYAELTGGGSAELELLDPNDPFSQGVLFSVRPPGKSWK